MPANLLQSQIDTLEEPGPDEDPLIVDVGASASEVAQQIIRRLSQEPEKSIHARNNHP
jgi:gluconate kinase